MYWKTGMHCPRIVLDVVYLLHQVSLQCIQLVLFSVHTLASSTGVFQLLRNLDEGTGRTQSCAETISDTATINARHLPGGSSHLDELQAVTDRDEEAARLNAATGSKSSLGVVTVHDTGAEVTLDTQPAVVEAPQ